jgi:S1-C subfamily serine protease
VPIKLNAAGHPTIQAAVTPVGKEPIMGTFVIDIGSGGSLALHSPFVREHGLAGANTKTIKAIGIGGAGGPSQGRIGRVSALKIGSFTIASPTAMFSEDTAGAFANAAIQGNIGQQIMSRFKIFLDYSRTRIILEPSETFGAPFDRAVSGLSLTTEGADYKIFRVTDVLENSPASEAGLQRKDIITAIDGRAAAELTITAVLELLERPVLYKLTIKRGDQTLAVTLTPRHMV